MAHKDKDVVASQKNILKIIIKVEILKLIVIYI